MEPAVSLKVSDDAIRPIIQKQIQTAVLAQIGNAEEVIGAMVTKALSYKVDAEGNRSKYSSDNKHDYLDVLTSRSIRKAAEQAMDQWLEKNSEKVKLAVLNELKKAKTQRAIAGAFAKCVEHAISTWRFKCNVNFTPEKDR